MISLATHAPVNVAAIDEAGPGGAHHEYVIQFGGPDDVLRVQFQRGPRGEAASTSGVFEDAFLAILEHRLTCFQAGPYACEENGAALDAVRGARAALASRVAKRQAQGVLGVNATHRT